MKRDVRDPQVELVRRYARILRSAPAEALRAWDDSTTEPSRFPRTPARRSRRAAPPASAPGTRATRVA
jgi:hypothetical protein